MKKAIVTGAGGFLGSYLCNELAKQGIEVFAVVRNKNSDVSRIDNSHNIKIVFCDMDNINSLPSIIKEKHIECFYHFAWEGTSGKLRGDYTVQLKNIFYSCKAVEISKILNCKKFVFASSIMEYEVYADMHTEENMSINTIYSSAKLEANLISKILANNLGIQYNNGIITNVYGPKEHNSRLINSSIRKLLNGEHCAFSSGEQMYDFIYVTDAVQAFISIGFKGKPNREYYIGSSNPKPLKNFLLEMRDIVSPYAEIGLGELESPNALLSYKEFNIDLLKIDTGFTPKFSFSEGIKLTADWIRGDK